MAIEGTSEGVSAARLQQVQQETSVRVAKQASDSQAQTAATLIEGATQAAPPPPGKGDKLNIIV